MSEPHQLNTDGAAAYHIAAIAAEATAMCDELSTYTETAAVQAERDLDGDLDELADELREAETQLRELADTAHYLAARP